VTEARKIDRAAFAGGVQSSLDSIFSRHFSHSARSARAVPHAFASTRSHSSGWCCAARGAAAEATSRRRSIVPIIIWPAARRRVGAAGGEAGEALQPGANSYGVHRDGCRHEYVRRHTPEDFEFTCPCAGWLPNLLTLQRAALALLDGAPRTGCGGAQSVIRNINLAPKPQNTLFRRPAWFQLQPPPFIQHPFQ
jgi:hypothetical protein